MFSRRSLFIILAIIAGLFATTAFAQTIHVTTANDVTDFGGAKQVADLPGPDGKVSLAEAGLASDNTPGVQTIGFQVPQNEWQYQWLYPGRLVLKPFLGFRVFATVNLDATTQTAFTGDTYAGGGEVVIWAQSYLVDTTGSVVRGFDSSSFSVSGGASNVLQGNTHANIDVFDSPNNLIGGVNPGEGNTCGTIKIDRASDNVIVGNTTTRVRILGWYGGGQPASNNRVGGPTLAERNYITGYGTWSSEGYPGGTTVQIFDSIGTVIENNWIGTTPDGLAQGSLASTQGIGFEGENHDALIKNNRIAGILGHGIGPHYAGWLVGSAVDVYGVGGNITIVGNKIGLDANDQPTLGSVSGIMTRNYYLGILSNVRIGGAAPGDANEIAGHLGVGVTVANTYFGTRIQGNSIHDNGGLGIDLVTNGFQYGVTPNDPLDADSGGNTLQNFPVLQNVSFSGSSLRVVGTLATAPNATHTLDFYASPLCDPSGYGEGRLHLGAVTVSTNAAGNAAFDELLPASGVAAGSFVTATATAANGSTSEFAACVGAMGSPDYWTDLGYALAGTAGAPQLAGNGSLTVGSTVQWTLSDARPLAPTWLLVGFTQILAPYAGGVIVPAPDVLLPLTSDAMGGVVISVFVPTTLPSGQSITTQFWIADPAGPAGFAASNAVSKTAP
jgi:hypothetical protein